MKTILLTLIILSSSLVLGMGQSRYVTMVVNTISGEPYVRTNELDIASNESAEILSIMGTGLDTPSPQAYYNTIEISKDGVTHELSGYYPREKVIAGPATLRLITTSGSARYMMTVRITPEAFPPGQTLILPEGTVGTVHVESSTNLISWQDEWSQTFSNTNQNRFFRLRAERSLP